MKDMGKHPGYLWPQQPQEAGFSIPAQLEPGNKDKRQQRRAEGIDDSVHYPEMPVCLVPLGVLRLWCPQRPVSLYIRVARLGFLRFRPLPAVPVQYGQRRQQGGHGSKQTFAGLVGGRIITVQLIFRQQ